MSDSIFVPEITIPALNRWRFNRAGGSNEQFMWEEKNPGFGVRQLRSGTKAFIVSGAIAGANRTRRRVLGRYTNKFGPQQARPKAKRLLGMMADGEDPWATPDEKRGKTLRRAMKDYIAKERLAPATVDDIKSTVDNHLSEWMDRPLFEIKRHEIMDRHNEIQEIVAARNAERFTSKEYAYDGRSTANGTMRWLRAIFNREIDRWDEDADGPAPGNPVSVALRRKGKKGWFQDRCRERTLDDNELRELFKVMSTWQGNHLAPCFLKFALYAGMRANEIGNMSWDWVDKDLIIIPEAQTKARRTFEIPITATIRTMLDEIRKHNDSFELDQRCRSFLFPSERAVSGHVTHYQWAAEALREKLSFHLNSHDLRRTLASLAVRLGASERMALSLLNDKPAGVAANYIILSASDRQPWMERVERHLATLQG